MKTFTLKNFISRQTKGTALVDLEKKGLQTYGLDWYQCEFFLGIIGDTIWFTTEGDVRYSGKTEKEITAKFEEFKKEQTK